MISEGIHIQQIPFLFAQSKSRGKEMIMKNYKNHHKNHHKKHQSSKRNHQKNYSPTKQHKNHPGHKHHPKNQSPVNSQAVKNGFFNGNLVANMDFGGTDQELSGYVKREFVVEDQYGNKQTAREKQFFNSGKKLGRVRVNDDESDF